MYILNPFYPGHRVLFMKILRLQRHQRLRSTRLCVAVFSIVFYSRTSLFDDGYRGFEQVLNVNKVTGV